MEKWEEREQRGVTGWEMERRGQEVTRCVWGQRGDARSSLAKSSPGTACWEAAFLQINLY